MPATPGRPLANDLSKTSSRSNLIKFTSKTKAVRIHSQPGIFQKAGQFPATESIDLPLSEEAQRFYKTGRPFL